MNKSEAKQVKEVFKKYKTLLKKRYERTDFKEPVMLLAKRSSKVEFYENATKGRFDFEHSDGDTRYIMLDPKFQLSFPYGDSVFKGYICHEDFPTPLPEQPVLTTEMFAIAQEKALYDINKMKKGLIEAKTDMLWKIAIGIAIVIVAFALYKTLVPNAPAPANTVSTIKTATEVVVQNATIIR